MTLNRLAWDYDWNNFQFYIFIVYFLLKREKQFHLYGE